MPYNHNVPSVKAVLKVRAVRQMLDSDNLVS